MRCKYLISPALLCGLVVLSVFTTATAVAAPIVVTNPGFEDITGESPFNEFTFGALNGWDLYDPDTITNNGDGPTFYIGTLTPFEPDPVGNPGVYANFPDGAIEGQRVGIAFNFEGSDGLGEYGFEQTLTGEPLVAHTRYTLEVEIGNITSATAMSGQFFPLEGFPGYRVDLLAGGAIARSDDNTLAGTIDDGQWGTSVITFVTGAEHPLLTQDLGIRLVNLNQLDPMFPDSDIEVDFDDVRLDAITLTPGDFDGDLDVDGEDYLVWARNFGSTHGSIDLGNWQTNLGDVTLASAISVPEPSTMVLVVFLLLNRWTRVLRLARSVIV